MNAGCVDRETLRRHLLALDEALTELKRHTGLAPELLFSNLSERWSVERGLQIAVQNVLDIATHWVASAGVDAPDYAAALDELGRLGLIPVPLCLKLKPLAGFRNALVHGYLRLDIARVHSVLNEHLDELREFASEVDGFLLR
jgi:uncharacterized protein YutE (UPF0331/DUF86 family)